ncbi:glycosyltransferase [Duganella sp. FT50W]|uniref:Glycosyltransferase n=1 Tax=Duganella lactea TaxID=2692173 RepID=A0A6L8MIJ3_9BURK|nr:glycosyltransferase family 4 protein [Duganella lactea]MYM82947.1 glycosyltransferase [Duganella lactea]
MKIVLLTSSMGAGGAERVAATLANAWSARGHQVTIMPTFSGRGDCFYPLADQVELRYLADVAGANGAGKKNWKTMLVRLLALRRFFRATRPDVIISFITNVNAAAVIASAGLRIPTIVCERSDPFAQPTTRIGKLYGALTYRFASCLMVQTAAVEQKYRQAKTRLKRLAVIPNPIPPQFELAPARRRESTRRHLVGVGRLADEKQFGLLIDIFARLASAHPDWHFHIVGKGPLEAQLQRRIDAHGLAQRIELRGPSSDIHATLQQADGFVLASRYEGFPNALLEAMATGLPCVTFDCPSGPREMTEAGQVALLVPSNDTAGMEQALRTLMGDAQLRERLGPQARSSVMRRFSVEAVLSQWEALFREVGALR